MPYMLEARHWLLNPPPQKNNVVAKNVENQLKKCPSTLGATIWR